MVAKGSFSRRNRYVGEAKQITIREEAPEGLRTTKDREPAVPFADFDDDDDDEVHAAADCFADEIAHQWLDYWDWSVLTDEVERAGHQPEVHTPLLYPGEVYTGAVLPVRLRVAAGDDGASYAIERTPAPALVHPTTRYRMGLIEASAVPDMVVFENQGQFDEETTSSPGCSAGSGVEGGSAPTRRSTGSRSPRGSAGA